MTAPTHTLPNGVHSAADGTITISGAALRWLSALDRAIRTSARKWRPTDYSFPPVIAAADLARLDYFRSFPHLFTAAASLPADPVALETFVQHCDLDSSGALPPTRFAPVDHVLTPAACYPGYAHRSGAELDHPEFLTMRATCFRRESHFVPLRRQWTFSMREVVCLGTGADVTSFLTDGRILVDGLARRLGIEVQWLPATDPFFAPRRSGRSLMQQLSPVKTEAVTHDLAIASLNVHHQHFGSAFDIRMHGEPAHSGCLAFGLERWLGVVADRWGPDPERWPDPERPGGPS